MFTSSKTPIENVFSMPRTIRYVRGAGCRKPHDRSNGYAGACQKSKLDQERTELSLLGRCDGYAGGFRGRASAHFDRRRHSRAAGLLRCLGSRVRGRGRRLRRSGVLRSRGGRSWIFRELHRRLHGARRCRCSLRRSRLVWRLLLGHQRLYRATYQNQNTSCHSRHSLIHSCPS